MEAWHINSDHVRPIELRSRWSVTRSLFASIIYLHIYMVPILTTITPDENTILECRNVGS